MSGTIYRWGRWQFEPAEYRLSRDGEAVALHAKALEVLALLVTRAPKLQSKSEILATVWPDAIVEEGNIAFHVAALRKVLDIEGEPSCIETVRGHGYRFVAELEGLGATPPSVPTEDSPPAERRKSRALWIAVSVALVIVAVVGWLAWRPQGPIDSVVIMPFQAVEPGGDQRYLEAGLAEAIAMRLGSATSLRVPPLAAIRRDEGPFEAGRRLGTRAVLTGTLQRAGDRLRVTAQLTGVRRGDRLWEWTFDTTAAELLAVQNEIAERIAVRLRLAASPANRDRLRRRETQSGAAYDLFLQARERWQRRTPEMVRQAITLYERAIALDPQFARAYAGLADCYNLAMSGLPPEYRYPRAKANAERAIALDPASSEAHLSLAFLRYKFEWRWDDADREFREAIRLDPNSAQAHHWYGEFLALMQREPEGIAELRRALELDPFSLAIRADLSHPLIRLKRVDEARRVLNDGLQIDPNWFAFPMIMSDILEAEGRDRESAEQRWRAMTLRGIPTAEIEELRAAFAKGGMQAMTRAQIQQRLRQEVQPTSSASFFLATYLAFDYGKLGEREAALRWLDIAIRRREDAVIHLLTNPAFDSLREEPRFKAHLAQLGLARFVKR
ncbi:MAG: winged helix-turn-helix domain-containing protein [Gemmatimonadaceae bacterium]|nr:winged helix-turn-helix domain-containing protein [Gemmatimonadaceae bacterium]